MHLVVIGGSDAGISAALRARELDPQCEVTVIVKDTYPNFSICGIPYYLSGEVGDWQQLAHRSIDELRATGMTLRLETTARILSPDDHSLLVADRGGTVETIPYDALVIGTGAVPVRPPIDGLSGQNVLGSEDGVHLVHSMGDALQLMRALSDTPRRTVIVGAGYIGLEMAESLVHRGLQVTQFEQLPEVLATLDPELGALVHNELEDNGVEVGCSTTVQSITRTHESAEGRLRIDATRDREVVTRFADVVIVVVGVRPDSELAATGGAATNVSGAIAVDRQMHTNLPDVFAAGDCALTYHRLLGDSYLPLGTTAHKQGRVAGENALGGTREFAGSLGTQVVKVFGLVAARSGLRDHEATAKGFHPLTVASVADDHKAYYPGARPIAIHITGDATCNQLLGVQLVGHQGSEVAKRIDTVAAALFHAMRVEELCDLDLSYSPPLGSPWDALQTTAQQWVHAVHEHRSVGERADRPTLE